MKHRAITWALVFAASLIVASPYVLAKSPPSRTSALSYHDLWRKLWEDHITWTRMVIMGTFDSLPGNDAYKARLIENYEHMEEALEPYYGEDAEELGDLILDHLLIAVNILDAAKAGDAAALDAAKTAWYDNGHDIAVFMSDMNPEFWPLDMTDPMWRDHLDATFAEAVAHLTNDFAGDVAAYDEVVDLAMEMADFMSDGVIRQFRTSFSGSQCVIGRQGNGDDDESGDDQGEDEDKGVIRPLVSGFTVSSVPAHGPRTFRFALTASTPVALVLFDVNGREMATVHRGELEAGPHTLVWNGHAGDDSRAAAGIYFARLTAGSDTKTIKLIETRP